MAAMRILTNSILFLVALLMLVGVYVLRHQTFGGLQKKFGVMFGNEGSQVSRSSHGPDSALPSTKSQSPASVLRRIPQVDELAMVIPLPPKTPTENIQIGMTRSLLWGDFGQPDVMTSSREGQRFLETYIYLSKSAKATVVRLVNGQVAWVANTRTNNPPVLVPQDNSKRMRVIQPPIPDNHPATLNPDSPKGPSTKDLRRSTSTYGVMALQRPGACALLL